MITVIADQTEAGERVFRAVSGDRIASGKTVGAAVDAFVEETSGSDWSDGGLANNVIWVQSFRPDRFFTAGQRDRLSELMQKWRSARDTGSAFSQNEQTELEALVEAETNAMAERTQALLNVHK